MTFLNYTLSVLVTMLVFAGCTKDFEELNTNPNAPVDVQPSLLLRQVIYDYQDVMSFEGFTGGANLGQYFSADPGFNAFDRGDLLAPQFGGNPWPSLYRNLRDIEIVLDKSRSTSTLAVYEGPALVLKSVIAATLTDIFGDVPYTEAVRGLEGFVSPSYDLQENIYLGKEGILDNLALAVTQMENYAGAVRLEGDELYSGNLNNWIRLANSLRLKYLVRAGKALDGDRLAELVALTAGGNYIQTADQDAVFRFGAAPNDFRFARARLGDFTNYLMSETIDSTLDKLQDPREELWFRMAANGGFNGIRNGIPSTFAYDGGDISLPGLIWRENSDQLKGNYMTAWETRLVLAEAAARGFYIANPATLYAEGVQLAFDYWNTPLPANYLTTGEAAFTTDDALEKINTQRWLASIGNGYEGWIEWRRTGYPQFLAPISSLNGGMIPVRFPYPADEQALNTENYQVAVSRLGGENSPNVPVWWAE